MKQFSTSRSQIGFSDQTLEKEQVSNCNFGSNGVQPQILSKGTMESGSVKFDVILCAINVI